MTAVSDVVRFDIEQLKKLSQLFNGLQIAKVILQAAENIFAM